MTIVYYQYFEYLSLLMAVACFQGLKRYGITLFIPLLLMVCIVETIAVNRFNWFGTRFNLDVYNHYFLLHPFFYLPLYYTMAAPAGLFKKVYLAVSALLLCWAILEYTFVSIDVYHHYTNISAQLVYFIMSFVVIGKLVLDENRVEKLQYHPYFWISLGMIMFCIVSIIVMGGHSYFLKNKVFFLGKPIYRSMMNIINCFFYGCYAYAFFIAWKRTRSSSRSAFHLTHA